MFTGAVMGQYGAVLGFVGLAFSAADCFAESLRGAPLRPWPTCFADALAQLSQGRTAVYLAWPSRARADGVVSLAEPARRSLRLVTGKKHSSLTLS